MLRALLWAQHEQTTKKQPRVKHSSGACGCTLSVSCFMPLPPRHSRLAPTPSGFLHWGNAFNFWHTWCQVRCSHGTLKLRVDDLDALRCQPVYIEALFADLEWLELDWDTGPMGPDALQREHSQQLRQGRYHELLEQLRTRGAVYACRCPRKQIQQWRQAHPESQLEYPGTCRSQNWPLDSPLPWRVRIPETGTLHLKTETGGVQKEWLHSGDFVVQRREGLPAYQVASLADDWDDGINWVVRGHDLYESTRRQLWLATVLEATSFQEATFEHHALVRDASGEKLSKTAGAPSLQAWRESGRSVQELRRRFAEWSGLPEEAGASPAALLQAWTERATRLEEARGTEGLL